MKKTNLLRWLATGLFALVMLGTAVPDVLRDPMALEGFARLGMPAYLVPFVGVAKVLGVAALLVPGCHGCANGPTPACSST